MNKKVLIIGGAGYIGGHTTDVLENNEYDVCVYDKLIYENRYLKDVKFIYGDVRSTEKIVEISKNYDIIILMAALVGDPACAVDIELTDSINHVAIKNICQQLPKNKHVIFMSTCSVYGAQHDLLNEDSKTNPLSAYASTKLLAEKYVEERNGTIFRLGTVYGIGDRYSRIRLDLVLNVLTLKSIYDKEINIFGGEQWRPLICVKDIAGYIFESIERDIRGTFILSEGNYTMKMLGEIVNKIYPDVNVQFTNISLEDARNYKVDNSKTLKKFNYRPIYSMEDEIKKMGKIFTEHRLPDIEETSFNNGKFIKTIYFSPSWIKKNVLLL